MTVPNQMRYLGKIMTAVCLVITMGFTPKTTPHPQPVSTTVPPTGFARYHDLYEQLELAQAGLSREAFELGLKGMESLHNQGVLENESVLSIADFSLPSNQQRLFVIDLEQGSVLFQTYVAHGRNSGKAMATRFSNRANSFQSSLGFFVTGETYTGKHGLSLRLDGQEPGINDRALDRGIVMHSADYASANWAARQGFIGRSLGCPAIPEELHQSIISTIAHGSCFFIYAPQYTTAKGHKLV
jgi:hypothetical protein